SARQVSAGRAGGVAVGFTAAGAYGMLGHVLRTARTALPQVEVVLREMVTRDQLDALTDRSLDLGLVRPPVTEPELESRPAMR
ncbi:LysR substrate-binding domain-containing protein, partial [Streptomyces xiaopingdaonensis]|uniref:LysR substrate-binding domain-containing protein n=1 Tax=Streptomyces xiaopingdaonensis TaxID=1565415 RepID=UPI0005245419